MVLLDDGLIFFVLDFDNDIHNGDDDAYAQQSITD